jgi:deoxyribodipyrimidine photo-lyase
LYVHIKYEGYVMRAKPSVVWFRQDLRLQDQQAWEDAVQKGGPIIPLYIWAPEEEGEWIPGSAAKWWLHHSLCSLESDLRRIGSSLILRQGSSVDSLLDIIRETGADAVFWNRRYEPAAVKRDATVFASLQQEGVKVHVSNSSLLYDPWTILTKEGKPYQVFTPFWKACLVHGEPCPFPSKNQHPICFQGRLFSEKLSSFALLPKLSWDCGLIQQWTPGTQGAMQLLDETVQGVIPDYLDHRNRPDLRGTSLLSPHLHWGEVSPRVVWHAVRQKWGSHPGAEGFLRQLIWREFAYTLLFHFPRTAQEGLKKEFDFFPWKKDKRLLKAWTDGKTGYPIVDAGMRQLWQTGWMHNRVRMIVASFLVKDLLIDWREGARWFWDTLVDADLANNTLGWQWVGGCGADAAPYFRIFNPVLQGQKFDQDGDYIRRWIPELNSLSNRWIHCPWEAPESELKQSAIVLGETYPLPIVDHVVVRKKALEAYRRMRKEIT